jgi:hypothetical protein
MSPELLFLACLILMMPLWLIVTWGISHGSGWQTLAKSFEAAVSIDGKRCFPSTMIVGGMFYRNLISMFANSDGLYLRPNFLIRLSHAPLFIPWDQLLNPFPFKGRLLQGTWIDVGSPLICKIAFLSSDVLEMHPVLRSQISRKA